LIALDEQYDQQASKLRKCLYQVKEAKIFSRMLEVQLAEAHTNVAAIESRETTMAEALKEAEDRHTQQLEDAYLVTRAKRRTLDIERQEPLVLDVIPIHPPERRRTCVAVPPAPPPSEVS